MFDIAAIAEMCHEVNRLWCTMNGDDTQKPWNEALAWQKEAAINGVEFHINNPGAGENASHDIWLAEKIEAGWTYGAVKDSVKLTHPCILPYHELSAVDRRKDSLFVAIVSAMTREI